MNTIIILSIIISASCLIAIWMLIKDKKHDVEIKVGRFKFSFKIHK